MIIGITGSFGAGKGAVVDYLKSKGFEHYSASGFITEELVRRGMPVNRDSMIAVANELRATHGPAYIVEALYARANEKEGNAVIESLRAVAEVKRVKELGGLIIGIDADSRIRYDRAVARGSEKDHVDYNHWLLQERQENNPDDPTKQDIFNALRQSDYLVENSGTLEELHTKLDEVFAKIRATE